MTHSIQILLLGLTLGGVYALMASGLTLIFGVMGIVNLAHAAFMILAAYIAFLAFMLYGIDPILSILIVMPVMFVLGLVIYRLLFARSFGDARGRGMTVLLTFALALVLEGVMGYAFTNIYRSTSPSYAAEALLFGPYYLPEGQFYATVMSIVDSRPLVGFSSAHPHGLRHPRDHAEPDRRAGRRRQRRPDLHAGLRHRHGARGRLGRHDVVPLHLLPGQALGVDRDSPLAGRSRWHGQSARRADRGTRRCRSRRPSSARSSVRPGRR